MVSYMTLMIVQDEVRVVFMDIGLNLINIITVKAKHKIKIGFNIFII